VKTGKSIGLAERSSEPSESVAKIVALDPENHDDVAFLAYRLWQERGSPFGSDQEDWFRAENELKRRIILVATARGGR
jgi:hypothetical protein